MIFALKHNKRVVLFKLNFEQQICYIIFAKDNKEVIHWGSGIEIYEIEQEDKPYYNLIVSDVKKFKFDIDDICDDLNIIVEVSLSLNEKYDRTNLFRDCTYIYITNTTVNSYLSEYLNYGNLDNVYKIVNELGVNKARLTFEKNFRVLDNLKLEPIFIYIYHKNKPFWRLNKLGLVFYYDKKTANFNYVGSGSGAFTDENWSYLLQCKLSVLLKMDITIFMLELLEQLKRELNIEDITLVKDNFHLTKYYTGFAFDEEILNQIRENGGILILSDEVKTRIKTEIAKFVLLKKDFVLQFNVNKHLNYLSYKILPNCKLYKMGV